MLLDGLRKLLLQDDAVSGFVSDRITPVVLVQPMCFPASTLQLISKRAIYTLEARVNVTQARVQIDVWSERYAQCEKVAAAVNAVIDNFTGDLPGGTHVFGVQLATSSDLFEEQARIYRISSDYYIQFSE